MLFAPDTVTANSSEMVQAVPSATSHVEHKVEREVDGAMSIPLARGNQMCMGITCVADILKDLASKAAQSTTCTQDQVVATFASFSKREREILGMERLPVSSDSRALAEHPTDRHKVRLGRTSLICFMKSLEFENGGITLEKVAAACVMAVEKDVAYEKSEAGRKVARALASCT